MVTHQQSVPNLDRRDSYLSEPILMDHYLTDEEYHSDPELQDASERLTPVL